MLLFFKEEEEEAEEEEKEEEGGGGGGKNYIRFCCCCCFVFCETGRERLFSCVKYIVSRRFIKPLQTTARHLTSWRSAKQRATRKDETPTLVCTLTCRHRAKLSQ